MIEVMFQIRKDKFKDHPAVIEELDLIDEDEQYIHLLSFDDDTYNSEDLLSKLFVATKFLFKNAI